MRITRLSSKGQVIIPQSVRDAHEWKPGIEFSVIDMAEGILLAPIKPFKPSSMRSVIGCTGYKGKKKSLKEMEMGIAKGARGRK